MLQEPAVGNAFFGREEVLGVLRKRVNALKGGYRQNLALTGQMLSGKSSILHQFLRGLNDPAFIPVYVEVLNEPFRAFADRFAATLLHNYLVFCGRESGKDLAFLTEASQELIPHTVYAVKEVRSLILKRRYNDAYRKLLNLTSILKEETGKSCIVILDEFHNLEKFRVKRPYLHFGKIMMIQKNTMYIVSSSQKNAIKKILSEKLALLFGNFEVVEISGFDARTSRAFLAEKFQTLAVPAIYTDYLIDFTDGNPFYLDVISRKITELANMQRITSIDEAIVIDAFTELLHSTSGTINQYFMNTIMNLLEKGIRDECVDILVALSCGRNRLAEVASWFNKKAPSGYASKISRLIEADLVYKNGVFYEIQDKVFEFWLRNVSHKKKAYLVDNPDERREDFRSAVRQDIACFLEENKRDPGERIKELFSLFGGETVEIGKKKRRLPRFIKIEVTKYPEREDMLNYQKPDRYWMCEIRRKKIDEPSMADFISRYPSAKENITKRVCVALGGIDPNALLLAKEKKVWVWGLDSVNQMMRLYRRHNLVRQ